MVSSVAGVDFEYDLEATDAARAALGLESAYCERLLELIRRHLDMDVTYLAVFDGDQYLVVSADADVEGGPLRAGLVGDIGESYCCRALDGRIPSAVANTHNLRATADLAATAKYDIAAYVGAPVRDADGRAIGMLCAINHDPAPVGVAESNLMHLFADLVSDLRLQTARPTKAAADEERDHVIEVIDGLTVAYQPIVDLGDGHITGVEALSRPHLEPTSPLHWLEIAERHGVRADLELAAIELALSDVALLPAHAYVAVNVSPWVFQSTRLDEALHDVVDPARVVIEITEHHQLQDLSALRGRILELRRHGFRVGIDDLGAGYSSLTAISRLHPDIIKVDRSFITDINTDRPRLALIGALRRFCDDIGADMVAEGIETRDELSALLAAGVRHGQGYLLQAPISPLTSVAVARSTWTNEIKQARRHRLAPHVRGRRLPRARR